jgi:hypothetical protein
MQKTAAIAMAPIRENEKAFFKMHLRDRTYITFSRYRIIGRQTNQNPKNTDSL